MGGEFSLNKDVTLALLKAQCASVSNIMPVLDCHDISRAAADHVRSNCRIPDHHCVTLNSCSRGTKVMKLFIKACGPVLPQSIKREYYMSI